MKTRIFLVLIVLGLGVSGICRGEQLHEASCIVKVTSDPAVLPVNFEIIQTLITSSGVGGKAYKEMVGEPEEATYDIFYEIFNVEPLTGGYGGRMGMGGMGMGMGGGFGGDMMGSGFGRAMMGGGGMAGSMYGGEHEEGEHEEGEEKKRPGRNIDPRMMMRDPLAMDLRMMIPGGRSTARAMGEPEETFLFNLHVTLKDKPVAEELMKAAVENLRKALEKVHNDYSSRFEGQLKSAEMEVEQAEVNFRQLQERLRELSGGRDLRRERICEDIEMLNSQVVDEGMQLQLHKVSERDLTERIARARTEAQERVKKDAVTSELEEMIRRQEQELTNAEQLAASGRSTAADIAEVRDKLSRARIELAKQRERLKQSAGGELAFKLQDKIASLSTETSLAQARLAQLENRLAMSKELLAKADDFELLSIKADVARRNLQEVMELCNGLRQRIRMVQPPMVSVIDAE
jgi:hypothetical protein